MELIVNVPLQQDERHAKGLERSNAGRGMDGDMLGTGREGSMLLLTYCRRAHEGSMKRAGQELC